LGDVELTSVKLFILGRPGSGKSTAYHYIEKYMELRYQNWFTSRYLDYIFLYAMYQHEKLFPMNNKPKQFRGTRFGGFDVIDFSVLDIALKDLEKQVRQNYYPLRDELIVIEFARDDYKKALNQFSPSFLKDAYFLYIDADVPTCIQRVKERVTGPQTKDNSDNFFVSKHILTKYYGKQIIHSDLKKDLHTPVDRRVKIINSRGSLSDFHMKVEKFISAILKEALAHPQITPKVPDPQVVTPLLVSPYR
jgi:hypothetical protein